MNESTKKATKEILPFKILNGHELANTAPEKIPALVDGLLLEVGVSMLCAKPKTGKSTLGRQLAVSVAEGQDFFGKATLCGDVLYLALEGPLGVVQQHLKKLGHSGKHGTIHVVHGHTPFDGELGLARLEETLKSLPKLRLVIVDPASKLLRLLDPDKAEDVGPAIEKLEMIAKRHQLHLMFLTHAKKKVTDDAGDAAIGSTSFRGGTDTNIFMLKNGKQRIITTEQRWGVGLEPTLLTFDQETQFMQLGSTVEDEEEARHAGKQNKTTERIQTEIRYALLGDKSLTTGELLEEVTGKSTTILAVLEQMEKAEKIVAVQDGKAKRYRAVAVPTEQKKEEVAA